MNLLFQIYIGLYILFASVTLCRLGGPMVFITAAPPRTQRDGGTAASRTNVVAVDISELPRPRDGIGPPRRGQAVEVAAVVAVCNPDGLAIGEAGGGREAHRVRVSVALEFYRVQGAKVNTPTTPGTPRSRSAPLPCAHSRRRSQRGTNAWQQTPGRCAMPRCRWWGERNPRGCRRRSCQGRTRSGSRGGWRSSGPFALVPIV